MFGAAVQCLFLIYDLLIITLSSGPVGNYKKVTALKNGTKTKVLLSVTRSSQFDNVYEWLTKTGAKRQQFVTNAVKEKWQMKFYSS